MARGGVALNRIADGVRRLERRVRGSALGPGRQNWLRLRIDGEPSEWTAPDFGRWRAAPSLLDWLRCLENAADDPRIAGVMFELRGEAGRPSANAALRRAVDGLRAANKATVAWVESPGLLQYALAARCERVFAPESAQLNLLGLRVEQFYFKALLDRLDVRPDVVHVGRYKSAAEPATRNSMSETQREQLEAWQGTVFEALVQAIAGGRGIEAERVRGLVDAALFPARDAMESGLLDGCCYADELESRLDFGVDGPGRRRLRHVEVVDAERYLALDVLAWDGAPSVRGASVDVAYYVVSGAIGRGSRSGVVLDAFRRTIEALRVDPRVRAVVLRVDSPGGDALASDLMHRELARLRREKPVIVSFADVAASGGYYLATAADEIHAEAESVTGSIGVVGGKLDLSRLYERLGIVKESVSRGARSGLFSETSGFTAPERRAVERELGAIYGIFLRRVAEGRGLDPSGVERIAQGRIWSGAAALELGLVDRIGGPIESLARARRRSGIASWESPRMRIEPKRASLARSLAQLAGA